MVSIKLVSTSLNDVKDVNSGQASSPRVQPLIVLIHEICIFQAIKVDEQIETRVFPVPKEMRLSCR